MMKYAALGVLVGIVLLSLGAPWLATHDPLQTNLDASLAAPSAAHWLGADWLGRDVFSRALYGGRRALVMAGGATLLAVLGGLVLGLLGGYRPVRGLIDALLALPGLLVALVVVSLLQNSLLAVSVAVGVAGIAPFARTTHDALQALRPLPFVESAVSIGAGEFRILTRHLLPNALPVLLAFLGVSFSWALLNGAALAFLGFMGDPNAPDWGVMLAAGRQTFARAPYEALAPGVLLTLTVGAVNRLTSN